MQLSLQEGKGSKTRLGIGEKKAAINRLDGLRIDKKDRDCFLLVMIL
jgi:hypothetical protein